MSRGLSYLDEHELLTRRPTELSSGRVEDAVNYTMMSPPAPTSRLAHGSACHPCSRPRYFFSPPQSSPPSSRSLRRRLLLCAPVGGRLPVRHSSAVPVLSPSRLCPERDAQRGPHRRRHMGAVTIISGGKIIFFFSGLEKYAAGGDCLRLRPVSTTMR